MSPLISIVVTLPTTPWYQVLIELLTPLIAVVIAVGGTLRDNRLRRSAAAEDRHRDERHALTRARRIRISSTSTTTDAAGHIEQTSSITVSNTTETAIYDLAISGATMYGAPMGAEWRVTSPQTGEIDFLDAHRQATFVGTWWRPGANGILGQGQLSSGSWTHVTPHLVWSNEDGIKFQMDGNGQEHVLRIVD